MVDEQVKRTLLAAAAGEPPPADGQVHFVGAGDGPCDAVLGFFAHFVVTAPIAEEEARPFLPPGDLNAPMGPHFLSWISDRLRSTPGSLDVVLTHRGSESATDPPAELVEVAADGHPRVRRALAYRRNCRVYQTVDELGVLIVGQGVAGRWEMAFEVDETARGRGLGLALARAASSLAPDGEPVFAQTAPGNVASLRVLLAAGYQPIGSEVLFLRD